MDVAMTTSTANRSHVEALNGFVSIRTSIVVRHRNVDGVHRGTQWVADRSIVLRAGIVAPIEALELLWSLEERGLEVTLEGEQFAVGPRARITDDDPAAIRRLGYTYKRLWRVGSPRCSKKR